MVITFVDVTQRRRVEQALRDSEHQLSQVKQLVELSHDPIFIWQFDGGIVEWNRGSAELYGYSREEALGRNKEQLLRTRVPGTSFAAIREQLSADGSWSGEVRHRTKDGRELTIESRIVLESLDGRKLALESTRDVSERKVWEEQQGLLLRELTHRVKNTLAVVQAIAHQTLRRAPSNADFVERFDGRLTALARAHDLLVKSEWKGADLEELARDQLGAYPDRLRIEGERVLLPADLATPFSLVLHELATNAAKHGALSRARGRVNLSWTVGSRNARQLAHASGCGKHRGAAGGAAGAAAA